MWYDKTRNEVIRSPKQIIVGEVQYPSNIFTLWSEVELNSIGIYALAEPTIVNTRYYTYVEAVDLSDTIPAMTYTTTPIDLVQLKANTVSQINEKAKELLALATSKYSPAEMAGWETLEKEASQYLMDGTIGSMLGGEASMSNQDVGVLANEVLTNAANFRNYRNFIVSTRYKKTQAVNALTTVEELIAYDLTVDTGWVVV